MAGALIETYRDFTLHEHLYGTVRYRHVRHVPGKDRQWGDANTVESARIQIDLWHQHVKDPVFGKAPRPRNFHLTNT